MGRSLSYDPELQGRRQPRQLPTRHPQGGRDIQPQLVLQIFLNGENLLLLSYTLFIKTTKCATSRTFEDTLIFKRSPLTTKLKGCV